MINVSGDPPKEEVSEETDINDTEQQENIEDTLPEEKTEIKENLFVRFFKGIANLFKRIFSKKPITAED